jgi:hypothetical protein
MEGGVHLRHIDMQVGWQRRPLRLGLAQHQHAVVDAQGHMLDAPVGGRVAQQFDPVQHVLDKGDQGLGILDDELR